MISLVVFLCAAEPTVLTLRGERVAALTLTQVQTLPSLDVDWKHHGEVRKAHGVALLELLKRAGWSAGLGGKDVSPKDKHSGARFVAIATASDGYQAIFSVAELMEGRTTAVLAFQLDGLSLPQESGPLRLLVPTDGDMMRSIYQVQTIDLIDMRQLPR